MSLCSLSVVHCTDLFPAGDLDIVSFAVYTDHAVTLEPMKQPECRQSKQWNAYPLKWYHYNFY